MLESESTENREGEDMEERREARLSGTEEEGSTVRRLLPTALVLLKEATGDAPVAHICVVVINILLSAIHQTELYNVVNVC